MAQQLQLVNGKIVEIPASTRCLRTKQCLTWCMVSSLYHNILAVTLINVRIHVCTLGKRSAKNDRDDLNSSAIHRHINSYIDFREPELKNNCSFSCNRHRRVLLIRVFQRHLSAWGGNTHPVSSLWSYAYWSMRQYQFGLHAMRQ